MFIHDIKKTLENVVFSRVCGGRNRTRTCDPIDVNDVLYQLSHATLFRTFLASLANRPEICLRLPIFDVNGLSALRQHLHSGFEGLYQLVLPTEPCDHICDPISGLNGPCHIHGHPSHRLSDTAGSAIRRSWKRSRPDCKKEYNTFTGNCQQKNLPFSTIQKSAILDGTGPERLRNISAAGILPFQAHLPRGFSGAAASCILLRVVVSLLGTERLFAQSGKERLWHDRA